MGFQRLSFKALAWGAVATPVTFLLFLSLAEITMREPPSHGALDPYSIYRLPIMHYVSSIWFTNLVLDLLLVLPLVAAGIVAAWKAPQFKIVHGVVAGWPGVALLIVALMFGSPKDFVVLFCSPLWSLGGAILERVFSRLRSVSVGARQS